MEGGIKVDRSTSQNRLGNPGSDRVLQDIGTLLGHWSENANLLKDVKMTFSTVMDPVSHHFLTHYVCTRCV